MKSKLLFFVFFIGVTKVFTQNVGVGTTSPSARLEVNKAVRSDIKIKSSSYTDTTQLIFSNKNGSAGTDFIFSSNQENGLNISSKSDFTSNTTANILDLKPNGNVGIGLPNPNLAGFVVRKKVGNSHAIFGDNTTGVSIESAFPGIHFNSYYNSGRKALANGYTTGMEMDPSVGSLVFYTSPTSSTTGATPSVFSRLTIDRLGQVGVNISTPGATLDINGSTAIRNNNFLEFGYGIVGKEVNAGKIGYGVFGMPDVLSIVGGGQGPTLIRKIKLWAESGTTIGGPAIVEGNLSVGTTVVPSGYKMSVDGKIIAEELRIQNSTAWPDYVFESNYNLMPLADVEQNIKTNKHLPNVPSANEVLRDGIIVGDMQKVLLRKIEELTLYIIEQEKRIKELENLNKN